MNDVLGILKAKKENVSSGLIQNVLGHRSCLLKLSIIVKRVWNCDKASTIRIKFEDFCSDKKNPCLIDQWRALI
jgi:hypothetical protein